ncbi:hypothetical protein FN846DRAFT_974486 [Sphaerosporella brunnea]|uniref:Uncharacterized protein n=1 Tax=Sphaerosporella brunnea TaxID=1250544 RepID=A0A5J5EGG1_9PEZI|nr:hypothetical protein FN846DRAFT_974486 [Sphaerosporella brunnea]
MSTPTYIEITPRTQPRHCIGISNFPFLDRPPPLTNTFQRDQPSPYGMAPANNSSSSPLTSKPLYYWIFIRLRLVLLLSFIYLLAAWFHLLFVYTIRLPKNVPQAGWTLVATSMIGIFYNFLFGCASCHTLGWHRPQAWVLLYFDVFVAVVLARGLMKLGPRPVGFVSCAGEYAAWTIHNGTKLSPEWKPRPGGAHWVDLLNAGNRTMPMSGPNQLCVVLAMGWWLTAFVVAITATLALLYLFLMVRFSPWGYGLLVRLPALYLRRRMIHRRRGPAAPPSSPQRIAAAAAATTTTTATTKPDLAAVLACYPVLEALIPLLHRVELLNLLVVSRDTNAAIHSAAGPQLKHVFAWTCAGYAHTACSLCALRICLREEGRHPWICSQLSGISRHHTCRRVCWRCLAKRQVRAEEPDRTSEPWALAPMSPTCADVFGEGERCARRWKMRQYRVSRRAGCADCRGSMGRSCWWVVGRSGVLCESEVHPHFEEYL